MASTKLSRTAGTPTSNKTFTISYWVKRSNIGSAGNGHIFDTFVDSSNRSQIHFDDDNVIDFRLAVSGTNIGRLKTNRVFRDTSAWMHILASVDTTLGTADDRVKLYINGVQETSFSTRVNPSINADFPMGGTHTLGAYGGGSNYFDGTLSHFHFTDGYAYTPSTFGESDSTSGIWKPKTAPSVTYGTNGFFLKFENSANMDLDSSPNNHTFTTGGTITQTQDTPSNNFATLNPLHKGDTLTGFTFANGNNTITFGSTTYPYTFSTQAVSSGKWYAEFKVTANPNDVSIGISNGEKSPYLSHSQYDYAYVGSNGNVQSNQSGSSYGSALSTNDILGVAMDLDNNRLFFSKNGTWQNSADPTSSTGAYTITAPSSTTNGVYHFAVGDFNSAASSVQCNFGNGKFGTSSVASSNSDSAGLGLFEYSVPSGYYSLCTKNIKNYG
jgi:hypothetical protein